MLGDFIPIVDGWLEADRKIPRKQRHTAWRLFCRLKTALCSLFFSQEKALDRKAGRFETVEKLRFPTNCVLTSQNTDVRKFPYGNFLPLRVRKPRYTPPVFVHLLRKRFFMRAAARLPFLHENKLYRQTEHSLTRGSVIFTILFYRTNVRFFLAFRSASCYNGLIENREGCAPLFNHRGG